MLMRRKEKIGRKLGGRGGVEESFTVNVRNSLVEVDKVRLSAV